MKNLLRLQELDLRIEALKAREVEIPKQKGKFDIHRKRLAAELAEREKVAKDLVLEQRGCEGEIEQRQTQIKKYDQQLLAVKKNEEYQALLHEIDMIKKQIAIKEERIISIMIEIDEAKARLEEDKKRISAELKDIDRQCGEIDAELEQAVQERKQLEEECLPIAALVSPDLLARYRKIRASKRGGPAVVPLNGEACTGCHMHVPPQVVNEILAGNKQHTCSHCGRLLFDRSNFSQEA